MTPRQIIDEIHRLIDDLAAAEYEHRKLPEFLVKLEDGEDWVKDMREFIGN